MADSTRMDLLLKDIGGKEKIVTKPAGREEHHDIPTEQMPPDAEQPSTQDEKPVMTEVEKAVPKTTDDSKIPDGAKLTTDDDFRIRFGYDWWDPPEEKIATANAALRPLPGKQQATPASNSQPTLFSPLVAITKFCYTTISKRWSQPIATAMFDKNQIWDYVWDLYYVDPAYYASANGKAMLLVPEEQFQGLIREINISFPEANVSLSDRLREEGFALDFSTIESPHLRPHYLGRTTSRADVENLWSGIKGSDVTQHESASDEDRQTLLKLMDRGEQVARPSKKRSKPKQPPTNQTFAAPQRSVAPKDIILPRVQRYFGLVPPADCGALGDATSKNAPMGDTPQAPPLYAIENEPVLIAIDVEAHERNSTVITEVGVATLDTRDIIGEDPGKFGLNWQKFIRARHFRVAEWFHHVNHEFIRGCPDRFEFGESETVSRDDLPSTLASCFNIPFSQDFMNIKGKEAMDAKEPGVRKDGDEKRNLILVGHDTKADISFLRSIGFDPTNRGNLMEVLDTASLYRVITGGESAEALLLMRRRRELTEPAPNTRSLGGINFDLGMTTWNLHNAGNDAAYTLWALMGMCVRGEESAKGPEVVIMDPPLDEIIQVRARDQREGWTLSDDASEEELAEMPSREPPRFWTVDGEPLDI